MSTAMIKEETINDTCCVCAGGGELLTPEEHDAGAPPMNVPLRTMLLHINNNKVIPEGKLCINCIRRAIEAYEFSTALGRTTPPLSDKIRSLRRKLHELTQKIDVFIVVGGPNANSGGAYSEDDIIVVEKDALAAAALADDEDLERARNACGDTVFQCSVCPLSFTHVQDYREHMATHPEGARHSCWMCGAQFSTKEALRDHSYLHATPQNLTCQLCNITFQSGAALRRHGATCAARCPACGAAAAGRAALAEHVRVEHSRRAPFACALCFRAAPSADALAAHALSHRRAERFVCGYDACVLRFATRADLLAHIRRAHAGAAPAPAAAPPAPAAAPPAPAAPAPAACPHCDRTFGSVAAMKRHVRVHRKELQQEETEWQLKMEEGGADEGEGEVDGEGEGGLEHVEYLEMDALHDLDVDLS